jgi:hypothetical protein
MDIIEVLPHAGITVVCVCQWDRRKFAPIW